MPYYSKKYFLTLIFLLIGIASFGQLNWRGDTPAYPAASISHVYSNISGLTPQRTVTVNHAINGGAFSGSTYPFVPSGDASRLAMGINFSSNVATTSNLTTTILFSHPACDVNFSIEGINQRATNNAFDRIQITSNLGNPTSISAPSTAGVNEVTGGNTITGITTGDATNSVSFVGQCITEITFTFTATPSSVSNPNTQFFSISDIFSNETFGDPFPVNFVSFNASQLSNSIELNWATANEISNQGFEVQRSSNASSFETIGLIEGKNEDSYYTFTDFNPKDGINYFRLKQKDFDGSFKFSKIIDVYYNEAGSFSIYPNPARAEEPISILGINNESSISIISPKGQLIHSSFTDNKVSLPSGVYFLELSNPFKVESKKLVVH